LQRGETQDDPPTHTLHSYRRTRMYAACTLANLLAHSPNDLCKGVGALLPREESSKLLTCSTTRTDRLNLQHTGKQHHQLPAAHSRPYPRHAGRRTNRHSLIYTHTSHQLVLVPYSFSFTLTRLSLIPLACSLSKCLEHTPIALTHRTHSRHNHPRSAHRTSHPVSHSLSLTCH
jgi:hypothetical protein